jgi:hypothetical protein
MKGLVILFLGVAVSLRVYGEEFVPMYQIIKDTLDKAVPAGKCFIYGKITYNEVPVNSGKVSTVNHKNFGVSDSAGVYSFLMDVSKTKLYAFQIGFREVVTDVHSFKNGHAVHIDFYLQEQHEMIMEEKPVIYAYSQQEIKTTLKMELTGNLTFSYPIYNNGWDAVVNNEGIIVDGKLYPYLFWEGESPGLGFQSSNSSFNGCQIRTDSTISFLEKKCEVFGFNQTETTDFITFWGPRIQRYNFAKIEFLVDEQYDVIGRLSVIPKPENIRRVYILFQGGDNYDSSITCRSDEMAPFSRNGCTIVEWGGTELSPEKNINP